MRTDNRGQYVPLYGGDEIVVGCGERSQNLSPNGTETETHSMHDHSHHHPGLVYANPAGSIEWAAGGAFAGRVLGGIPGLLFYYATAAEDEDGKKEKPTAGPYIVRWVGQIAGAAAGGYLGAPDAMKTRAAVGAAVGGSIPFLGAPLAAVGAYVATRPGGGRKANPMSTGATIGLALGGLALLGGGTYLGVRALKARKDEKDAENGDVIGNLDEWGWDLDRYEVWGHGPVVGQDGQDYAYGIYHDTVEDNYWVDFRGGTEAADPAEPIGPFATSDEAEIYVESELPGV